MDCFNSIETSGVMTKPNYWTHQSDLQRNLQPGVNQFQSFWPTPILSDYEEPLSSNVLQTIGHPQNNGGISPTFIPHSQPSWKLQIPSQGDSTLEPAASAWPSTTSHENWQNPMITQGTIIQSQHITQYPMTRGIVRTVPSGIQRPSQTPNRPTGIVKNKRKRKRTAFTTEQILALEKIFSTQPYIDRTERQSISDKLNIHERAIKIWFQNRRMKSKRDSMEDSDDQDDIRGEVFISQNSPPSEFDYIETHIQRTDQFGFVTLDDNVLGTLVNVLDEILPANVELATENKPSITEASVQMEFNKAQTALKEYITVQSSELSTVDPIVTPSIDYEPISPAESNPSDNLDWEPPQDVESLKKLFNLHFC